jgi:hypothetical protein
MRIRGPLANALPTDQRRDLLRGFDVRLREEVRVCTQDRLGTVAGSRRRDVHRHAVRQGERGVRVAEHAERAGQKPGRLPVA